jgi:tripartite-type tricarboxylate transporter receptor subunit TctC
MRLLAALVMVFYGCNAWAQSWPARPVRMVIAAAPGGNTDVLGRAHRLSERLGQPFVPENRGAGGGVVAAVFVAKSPPDGYTLLMSNDQLVVGAASASKLLYDPFKDFLPLAVVARGPVVLTRR